MVDEIGRLKQNGMLRGVVDWSYLDFCRVGRWTSNWLSGMDAFNEGGRRAETRSTLSAVLPQAALH